MLDLYVRVARLYGANFRPGRQSVFNAMPLLYD
jgi:hypothetical protein